MKEPSLLSKNDYSIQRHVGFYLIDRGLLQLNKVLGVRRTWIQKLRYFVRRRALFSYLGSTLFITAGLTALLLFKASYSGVSAIGLWLLGVVIALCGSQLAVGLVNLGAALLVPPQTLPRLDFTKGIPASCRTLVVVPAMLSSEASIETLVEALEVRFLGNRDPHLHFALLTDFNDAPQEYRPEDAALIALVHMRITELNARYSGKEQDIFFLFHRPRRWNASERVWMGRERKRGKLSDLNHLLRGNNQSAFSSIVGRTAVLADVKYVITLDTDTLLPRESARQLIATMAHPLNCPRLDPSKQTVIAGHGILQPRVAEALSSRKPTLYTQLTGSELGIDPYTRAVSNVYQDLFDEGSFIGKGIYDVDVFEEVLGERFPDDRILSHDLLEGCYLRAGFLSDVPLYEKSPSNYLADAKRRVRWIRGDWQLLAWLFPWVPNGHGRRVKNPLSTLSKIKIFDNLRRSGVPVALLLLLGLNWTLLPPTGFWLCIILAIIIVPTLVITLIELVRKPSDQLTHQHIVNMTHIIRRRLAQLALYLTCLPHEAIYSMDAIVRTLWRLLISKRHLLQWTPSDQVDQTLKNTKRAWIVNLWVGPAVALVSIFLLLLHHRFESLFAATPLLFLWLTSPLILRGLSQPIQKAEHQLDAEQIRFLRRMARKTWAFFETFITAADHWLPPDNYQEVPVAVLARRTSPTNMGLALLANLTAYDFGYIPISILIERTSNALATMNKLERYRGHLYNWYNTETLEPLLPRYISSVDSGNLAGHLLTLRQGLFALSNAPLLNARYLDGLEDTCDVLVSMMSALPPEMTHFQTVVQTARSSLENETDALNACVTLIDAAKAIMALTLPEEMMPWSNKLLAQCQALYDEINLYAKFSPLTAKTSLKEIAHLEEKQASEWARERLDFIKTLALQAFSLAQMDLSFLYDEANYLMTIGFNVDEQRRDPSNYDLLASEARFGSFIGIAQGQIQQENWFALGRLLVASGGEPILVSWSGSMFEYLMPLLVMPTYSDTLLDQTYHTAVRRQINYGKHRGVPWGVSESGYNAVDTQFNYLYRAFGVPGLGLKRGLEEDLVVAPYASVMALMVAPEAACLNLQRLATEHATGPLGFYEAIDFTPARLPPDNKRALVRSFMAHHQGMSFLAFSYLLHDQPMQKRFMADPLFQATSLLLQERVPKPTASYLQIPKSPDINVAATRPEASIRVFNTPNTRSPQVQLLSNGCYHVVITQAGGGYSRWKELAITRWREDSTCDGWGLFSYVRDVTTGGFWSTNYQPTAGTVDQFKAVFSDAHVEFSRTDLRLDTRTEVVVSPEDDIELRRVRIHNRSKIRRTIEFTSYGEIVLAPQAADQAQATFSNLFVETQILPEKHTLLATRRPQNDEQIPPWLCHLLNVYSDEPYTLSFETDRARFIGRGRTLAAPLAMITPGGLSNTAGAVLDPIMAIRCQVVLEADALVTFDLITGIADTHDHCMALVEKYQDHRLANRIFGLAWTHAQVLLHQLNITEANARLYEKLASAIIYTSPKQRAKPSILATNRRGQSGLWGYSISGDLPIILLQIEDVANLELVRQLIQAQAYWRRKGLIVDLVILNQEHVSYRQSLQDQIMSLITTATVSESAGSIIVRVAEQIPMEDCILLQSVARVILSDQRGTLKEQLNRHSIHPPVMPLLKVSPLPRRFIPQQRIIRPDTLQLFNGFGGFNHAGDEYVIHLAEGMNTPAPWANVLANPNFGSLVSESGQGYTWVDNAHEFRLTPWDNDPLKDSSGEAFYLRDEETGEYWSPTALPCRGSGDYQTRHGFGYSIFEHIEHGIYSELSMYVAADAPLKFMVLKLRNDSSQLRRLSATGFVTWVLGDLRTKQSMHVVTELSSNGTLFAQNHYNIEFNERTAFFDATTSNLGLNSRTVTGDRAEFIGRNGSLQGPAALKRQRLSGRVGAGLDPCAAIQLNFDLAQDQSREIVFILGAGKDKQEAEGLVERHRGNAAQVVLVALRKHWQNILGTVKVHTPDPTLNLLANGWLLYQALSSRLWGRSGYYQSGGAFGFRDQLQDVMALTSISPDLTRAHLLMCAAHQFEEGDVQHWWHPPQNRGVRTRCSDDFLWLPFVLCYYLETTGDNAVLDEKVHFLRGRTLNADEESYYDLPTLGSTASLYQHAVRAIQHGLKFGVHGLPLMGSGDWNDGMSEVGKAGKGESVWLAFFLFSVLKQFVPVAMRYGDELFAGHCRAECEKLQVHIEEAWDGQWYRRAYFDDGSPLGSVGNRECQVDSIAQSWAVLSGAADSVRARTALSSMYDRLVCSAEGLIKLLAPPFDHSKPSPGYITGYVPGIRENGGQYTHAAVWAAMAFARLGEKERAWELFDLINPINHGRDLADIERYKLEPYVVAADVYGVAPHTGRGGWSWYTGAAGLLYRLIVETLLGVHLEEGRRLRFAPVLPEGWEGYRLDYRFGRAVYRITVRIVTEGEVSDTVELADDGEEHEIVIVIPAEVPC